MVTATDTPKAGVLKRTKTEPAIVLTAAGDFGYSLAQLHGSTIHVNEPSYYIREGLSNLPDMPEEGVFTYISGDAKELVGRHIAVGSAAYAIDPDNCQKNSDDKANKLDSALIMVLGLLTYQKGLPEVFTLNLLTCLQKVTKELRRYAMETLSGTHEIKCGRRFHKITINPLGCGDEGIGVLLGVPNLNANGNIVVMSIGGGTINVSSFYRRKLVNQEPFPMGVMDLYQKIALAPSVTDVLRSTSGDIHVIRQGVERGDMYYGALAAHDRFSFEDDYHALLKVWFQEAFVRPLQLANKFMKTADAGLVFGGGAMLPGIEPLLRKYNFRVVDDPVNANVQGLYEIAKALVAKGGKASG